MKKDLWVLNTTLMNAAILMIVLRCEVKMQQTRLKRKLSRDVKR